MAETGPKTYLGAVGLETLKEWAEEEIQSRGGQVVTPVISYAEATGLVTITCQTPNADIRYTLDKSEPTKGSTAYTAPFSVDGTVTIKAKAYKDNLVGSRTAQLMVVTTKIAAVRFPISGNTGTRLTPDTDPLGLVTVTITEEPEGEIPGTRTGHSQFDEYGPWQKRRCNFESGAFKCWDDDPSFSTTLYDTMVYYPDAYIRYERDESAETETFYIGSGPFAGASKAPWSGFYGAAYETSNSNESKSGKTVQVSQSITTMRTNARAKGTGWNLLDAVMHAADQWLFAVEYASRDSQAKIGAGISGASAKHNTGETDVLTYHTGRCAGTDDECAVRYRWSENLWGNTFKWCDGVQEIEAGKIYVTDNPELYGATSNSGWTLMLEISSTLGASNYIGKFKHNSTVDWCCFIPEETGTASVNAAPDYVYINRVSNFVLYVSGRWSNGSGCGLWDFHQGYASSSTDSNVGSRLTYRPAS